MKSFVQLLTLSALCLAWTSTGLAQNTVLYDFTATWCGPCQQMNPIIHKLEREGYPIQKVDIDQNPELARQYNISSIPAFVLVSQGREVTRFVGRTTENQLKQMFAMAPAAAQATSANPGNPSARQGNNGQRNEGNNGQRNGGQGSSGYEQPVLGQSEPFPTNPPASTAAAAPENNTLADYRTPGRLSSPPAGAVSNPSQWAGSSSAESPVIRAQFDESNNVTKPTPHIDSRAANVRIRIKDEKGINFGSGTIIESRPGVTYVLTCGHIFRNLTTNSKVDVDIFTEGRYETFVGKVEKYDIDGDVGLVSIPTDGVLPVARLANARKALPVGSNVISVGCSGGQPPTIEQLSITALNRYTGPDNIECTGVPVQGRSGGGLFNEENEIVGVCIAADPKEKRGLYSGLAPVLELIENCGLSHLIRNQPVNEAPAELAANSADFPATAPPGAFPAVPDAAPLNPGFSEPSAQGLMTQSPEQLAQTLQQLQAAGGAKLTIIIENPQNPGQTQVVIIPSATPRLIADLTGELHVPGQATAQHNITTNREQAQPFPLEAFSNPPATAQTSPMQRIQREEDRSLLPTDFSVAQPFRRVRQ